MTTPCDRPLKMRGTRTVGLCLENGTGQCALRGGTVVRAGRWCVLVEKIPLDTGPRKQSCHDGRRLFRQQAKLRLSSHESVTTVKVLKTKMRRRALGRRRGTGRDVERTGQKDRQTDGHDATGQHVSMDALSLSPAGISLMPDDDNNCCLFVFVFLFVRSFDHHDALPPPTN